MRLGIDAREIQDGVYTGIGRALANFLKYFSEFSDNDECILFSSKPLPISLGANLKNVVIKEGSTFYWDQVKLPKAIKNENVDIFYSPYYKIPFNVLCITVSSILDLMYLSFTPYKQRLGFLKRIYYATFGRLCALKSDVVLTCSIYSKLDILRLYNISPNKITIMPLSLSNIYHPETDKEKISRMKEKYGINGKYFLYLGNFKMHKNVESIISAFAEIVEEYPEIKLVLAGPKIHTYKQLRATVEVNSLSDKVIFTGKINESDEPHIIYSGAEAFIMPSFYEGFGLPPLEAMACGTPVIVSNTTSIPEVVKDAGLYVNPSSIEDIVDAIIKIMDCPEIKNELVKKGLEYVSKYDEKEIAKQLFDFFKKLERGSR